LSYSTIMGEWLENGLSDFKMTLKMNIFEYE
jgi:hypothetical protein